MTLDLNLRPSQRKIITYTGGALGIAAVPGAGKTFVLSALAADLIARGALQADQEVLVVTLVNSAVDNFASRISGFIQKRGLIPHIGYRVRTLHGLAHDIVREKPSRVGLEERFQIVDEREADSIRRDATTAWLAAHPAALDDFLNPDLDESKRDWVKRKHLPDLVAAIALAFIRSAKDHRLSPDGLRHKLDSSPASLPLAEMGWAIYSDYQRALIYRGAVDFDDLIRLALDLVEGDAEFLERLRYRFPYILEDEAQDSSELQEQILRLLSGPGGNWVRVGDPNQAIFETFTTASPELLRAFIREHPHVDMPESGRSQPAIIALANRMIDWVNASHPEQDARSALSTPYIQPVSPGDPQANPPDDPAALRLIDRKFTPDQELEAVVQSLEQWLPEHADWTVAVLVPRNLRGADLIGALKKKGIDYVEFLSSTFTTRAAAGALSNLIHFLADPQSAGKLARVYEVWRRDWREIGERLPIYKRTSNLLRKIHQVEDYLAPNPGKDWLEHLGTGTPSGKDQENFDEQIIAELVSFRGIVQRWLAAVTLPIDQLILTLSSDIFSGPADLALAHKLALVLRQAADEHPDWRLPDLASELAVIARNERRFIGFSDDDSGFDPDRHRGRVVVTTIHKAKGLEWDRVYLMSVNNYDFPSNQPNDRYISEKWFVRDNLNLESETLAQLAATRSQDEFGWYREGQATQSARLDYVRERLRLFYVGITRARRDLIVTWNTGRKGDQTPAVPFVALKDGVNQNAGHETIEV
ncbi:MAG: ATP-dependent helicase [Chloroflexota bacterium]